MKRKIINNNGRNKAFLGAAIGAIGNIAGGIISGRKQKKAQEEAQKEQTRSEGVQQAAAMSAQYANQDYVDQYRQKITLKNGGKTKMNKKDNDRIAVAKRYKCGGRKKASLGVDIKNDFNGFKTAFNRDNLGNTITDIANAASATVNHQPYAPVNNNNMSANASTRAYIDSARDTANDANQRNTMRNGGRRKKADMGLLSGVLGGVSSATSAATTPSPINTKKGDGFSFDAPKTGLTQNSYQVDANNNPITAVNNENTPNSIYQDRMQQENQMRCGGRKRKCSGGRVKRCAGGKSKSK